MKAEYLIKIDSEKYCFQIWEVWEDDINYVESRGVRPVTYEKSSMIYSSEDLVEFLKFVESLAK